MDIRFIQNIAQQVFLHSPVRRAYLFGSAARGEALPGSDLDILVELDTTRLVGLVEYIKIQMQLEEALHTKVDLVSADGISPYIAPFIHQDKKLIYEA